jgi:hypothetical protein
MRMTVLSKRYVVFNDVLLSTHEEELGPSLAGSWIVLYQGKN